MKTYALEISFPPGTDNCNLHVATEQSRHPNTFRRGEVICTLLAGH